MTFIADGREVDLFAHDHNDTLTNERAVELALCARWLPKQRGEGIEVGNVLAHYADTIDVPARRIVDAYEVAPGVENVDLFAVRGSYDWLVSISTIEHVRQDVDGDNEYGGVAALTYLSGLVKPRGHMFITVGLGENPILDGSLLGLEHGTTFVRVRDGWFQNANTDVVAVRADAWGERRVDRRDVKILMLADLWVPFPGGAERLAFNIGRDLMQRGHDVHVLTSYAAAQRFDGPAITYEPIGVFDDHAAGAKRVQRALDRIDPDVVITHALFAYQFATVLDACPARIVQVVLNTSRLVCADLAVYISEFVVGLAGGFRPGDLVITPPVFDDVIADTHGDAVGMIKPIEHKGIDLVYDVARLLPERRFVILRGEWPTTETIDDTIANVEFMPAVDDIVDFYREVRVVLMPSISEDAGTVAQECALNGIPCINSNVGGLRETNAGGVRFDRHDAGPYARAIMLLDDPDTCARVVATQRAHLHATDQEERMSMLTKAIEALL